MRKLNILGAAAKYDVSCASSGAERAGQKGSLGNNVGCGICHTWTEDGRCLSLLKVLMTNVCSYDCAYCPSRKSNDVPRATFTPRELADLAIEFYRRNYIEGLFLSSAVLVSPDHTSELFLKVLDILRNEYRFRGYIHTKVIPGTSDELITRIGMLADRLSVNMEFATKKSLSLLAGNKDHQAILQPMALIQRQRAENKEALQKYRRAAPFAPSGQATQFIVGATGERDLTLLRLTGDLYNKMHLKRVYYSAYIPVAGNPLLPAVTTMPPLKREHRLYQADWLLRFYGFTVNEIVDETTPNLDLEVDPKINYALRHPELFPVEINSADLELLLRVPGIGPTSANRIYEARKFGRLDELGLRKTGIVMKRAKFFITVNGHFLGTCTPDNPVLRSILSDGSNHHQASLFDMQNTSQPADDSFAREPHLLETAV